MAKPKPTKMLAILGRCHRTGRWRIAARSSVLAVLGSCRLDMRASFVDEGQDQMKMKVTVVLGSAVLVLPDGAEVRPSGVSLLAGSLVDVPEHDENSGLPMLDIEWTCVLGRMQIVTGPVLDELKAAADAAREAKREARRARQKRGKKAPSKPILEELAEREQARQAVDRPAEEELPRPVEPVATTVSGAAPSQGALIGGSTLIGAPAPGPAPEPASDHGAGGPLEPAPAPVDHQVAEPEVAAPEVAAAEAAAAEAAAAEAAAPEAAAEPEVGAAWASHDWGDDPAAPEPGSEAGGDPGDVSSSAADDLDGLDLGEAWRSHDWGDGLDGEGGSEAGAGDVDGLDLGEAWRSHDWGDGLDGEGGSEAGAGDVDGLDLGEAWRSHDWGDGLDGEGGSVAAAGSDPAGADDEADDEADNEADDDIGLPAEVAEAWRSHDWGDGPVGAEDGEDGADEPNPGRRATDQPSTSRSGA